MRTLLSIGLVVWAALSLAQTEQLTLMSYNLMYYKASNLPCTHTRNPADRDSDLRTIIKSVGPDLLVVNELGDNPINPPIMLNDILNVDGINYYDRANSTNNSFSSLVNMLFYNSDKLTLHSQQTLERDRNGFPLVRVIDFYRLYLNDPGLGQAGVDTVFFTVISAHLKAGSTSGDENQRANAAEAIMRFIETNVPDDNVLLAGDLNLKSSSEAAYQELINYSNSSVALADPLNRPGNWNNNSTFSSIHTQSTRSNGSGCFSGGGMDDRFDLILVSDEILDNNNNLRYRQYRTVGQDGGSFNGNLNTTTNLSVNSTVATALFNFSDHLPVSITLEADVSGIGMSEVQKWEQALWIENPVKERFSLHLRDFQGRGEVEMQVLAPNGQVVLKSSLKPESGEWEQSWPSSGWPTGIYLLQLRTPRGGIISRKLLKS